jgi:hypothetical protein
MRRKDAIHKLALEALGDYSTKKRREIIECWFVIGYEKA